MQLMLFLFLFIFLRVMAFLKRFKAMVDGGFGPQTLLSLRAIFITF
jgi:hypothetical protein